MLKSFSEIQAKLDKKVPLKLRFYSTENILKVNKNPREFLKKFFEKYNKNHSTVYTTSGQIQTTSQRTRSAHDIYRITKFYFPDVTYEDIHIILEQFACKGQLIGEWCSGVHEHVYSLNTIEDQEGYDLEDLSFTGGKYNEPKLHHQFLGEYLMQDKMQEIRHAYKNNASNIGI